MFCPKCGQQQISDDTRFCSRCGVAIGGLTEWLTKSDGAGVRKGAGPGPIDWSRKEIKRGVKVMMLAGVLAPVFFGASVMVDNPGPLLIPLSVFLLGIALILYSHLFGESSSRKTSQASQPSQIGTGTGVNALPPASSIGINDLAGQRIQTAEMVQPPSVTDRTTKLLESEEQRAKGEELRAKSEGLRAKS
jgi:hypothetical protein